MRWVCLGASGLRGLGGRGVRRPAAVVRVGLLGCCWVCGMRRTRAPMTCSSREWGESARQREKVASLQLRRRHQHSMIVHTSTASVLMPTSLMSRAEPAEALSFWWEGGNVGMRESAPTPTSLVSRTGWQQCNVTNATCRARSPSLTQGLKSHLPTRPSI
eukprot:362349-Chlamydomonas_euryale.AAC.6